MSDPPLRTGASDFPSQVKPPTGQAHVTLTLIDLSFLHVSRELVPIDPPDLYLVIWRGLPESDATWEPATLLNSALLADAPSLSPAEPSSPV